MAGTPPGMPMMPPGGPPPGMPPPLPPPGLPPGIAATPPGLPPVGGPPPGSPFVDLVDKLPAHYQLLDVSASMIEQAINTGGFYREPKILAGVREIHSQLSSVIANRTREGKFGAPEASPKDPLGGISPGEGADGEDDEGADTEPS